MRNNLSWWRGGVEPVIFTGTPPLLRMRVEVVVEAEGGVVVVVVVVVVVGVGVGGVDAEGEVVTCAEG